MLFGGPKNHYRLLESKIVRRVGPYPQLLLALLIVSSISSAVSADYDGDGFDGPWGDYDDYDATQWTDYDNDGYGDNWADSDWTENRTNVSLALSHYRQRSFNQDGNMLSEIWYDSLDKVTRESKWEYNPNGIMHSYARDLYGDGLFEQVTYYDERGNVSQVNSYYSNGTLSSLTNYTIMYDSSGNKLFQISESWNWNSGLSSGSEYRWEYNALGLETSYTRDYDRDGFLDYEMTKTYDSVGNKLTETVDSNGDGFDNWGYQWSYDADGNILTYSRDIGGSMTWKHRYDYDANDHIILDDYDKDGDGIYDDRETWVYNSMGLETSYTEDIYTDGTIERTRTTTYDAQGNELQFSELYEYPDELGEYAGHRIRQSNYNSNGNITSHFQNSSYSDASNWDPPPICPQITATKEYWTYDQSFNLLSHTTDNHDDGSVEINHEYTYSDGKLTSEEKSDRLMVATGNPFSGPTSCDEQLWNYQWDYTYDNQGRLINILEATRDHNGDVTRGQTSTIYDDDGYISSIEEADMDQFYEITSKDVYSFEDVVEISSIFTYDNWIRFESFVIPTIIGEYVDNATTPDFCPTVWGNSTVDYYGCPDADGDGWSWLTDLNDSNPFEWIDSDGDGVGDNGDDCPFDAGNLSEIGSNGCPDGDGDLVADIYDRCPDLYGNGTILSDLGCPDTDGDGYYDGTDDCPNTIGNLTAVGNVGCPDRDEDGIADRIDVYPDDSTQWSDTDGDGYGDNWGDAEDNASRIDSGIGQFVAGANNPDDCPNVMGASHSDRKGCIDTDRDGVSDDNDACSATLNVKVDSNGCEVETSLFGGEGGVGGILIHLLWIIPLLAALVGGSFFAYNKYGGDSGLFATMQPSSTMEEAPPPEETGFEPQESAEPAMLPSYEHLPPGGDYSHIGDVAVYNSPDGTKWYQQQDGSFVKN